MLLCRDIYWQAAKCQNCNTAESRQANCYLKLLNVWFLSPDSSC